MTGRLVDVRAPRFDAAWVPKASPAVAMGTPRSRAAGLVAFAPRVDAASVAALVGRGDGLTPLGDDVVCGWLAAHRARRRPDPDGRRRRTPAPAAHHHALRDPARLRPGRRGRRPGRGLPPLPRYAGRGRPRGPRSRPFGHSSGLGLAHGIDLALRALTAERRGAA